VALHDLLGLARSLADPHRRESCAPSGLRHGRDDETHSQQADRRFARGSRQGYRRDPRADRGHLEATDAAIRLEELRNASEATAFRAMLEAAMVRVLSEAAWARKTYPQDLKTGAFTLDHLPLVRRCITKGAFAELRAACVRQGGPLTSDFLDLEREIDSFASPQPYADPGKQLALIETKATELRERAAERI
jgi:hypothetical protein